MADEQQQYATFEEIAAIDDMGPRDILVPEWSPRPLRARPLSVSEADAMARAATDPKTGQFDSNKGNQIMVRTCLVAPALTAAQVAVLWTKSAGTMMKLVKQLNVLNGFADDEAAAAATQEAAQRAFRAESGPAV